jgi:hypothetical protein
MSAPAKKVEVKPLVVNLDTTIPFLRSVSYAIVAQQTTRVEWKEDTGPIKTLYAVFLGAFGTPGTAEVRTATEAEMRRRVDLETHHRIDVLVTRMEAGPAAVAKYLRDLDEIRATCLKGVQLQYADAGSINREIAEMWGQSTRFLAKVELGSTLAVKGMTLVPGPGWAVALGYDALHQTINDFEHAGEANSVVATASEELLKETAEEATEKAAEKIVDRLNKQPTRAELKHALARVRQLEDKIARQFEKLARRHRQVQAGLADHGTASSIQSMNRQIPRNVARLDAAQKSTARAAGKFALARTVSWVFMAKDVSDAMTRYEQLTKGRP